MKKERVQMLVARAVFFLTAMVAFFSADAQCAMCRAVAEESMYDDAYGFAMGLNAGIILLMFVPYLLLATLFVIFFRKQIAGFFKSFNEIH